MCGHRLRELKDQVRRYGGTGGDDLHPVVGFNFKYTNLQAAIGLAQLERLDERVAHFAQRDSWYRELLSSCPGISFPERPNWKGEVLQWTDILCTDRLPYRHPKFCRACWSESPPFCTALGDGLEAAPSMSPNGL